MQTALDLLLSPMGEDEFFRDYWERRRLYVKRDDPEHFATLLSPSDLPQVIAAAVQAMHDQPPQAAPFLEILAYGKEPRAVAEVPTVAAVYAAFDAGATVRLNHMHHFWPPMKSYLRRLESELGFIASPSAYCTPAGGPGTGVHYDGHDTAVVQIAGSKLWRVGPGPALPLEYVPLLPFETREEMRRYRVPMPAITGLAEMEEILLSPGDFLYLPRGIIHDVQALDTFTVHLTFGIQQITWVDFIAALAAAAGLRDPRLRRSIPVRHHRTQPEAMRAAAEEALAALAESASAAEAFASIAAQFERIAPPG
jgi:ribosomal protein L16 Arg81 hydroxylase